MEDINSRKTANFSHIVTGIYSNGSSKHKSCNTSLLARVSKMGVLFTIVTILNFLIINVNAQEQAQDFAPHVTATCKGGTMNIKVQFSSPYYGAVHAREHRIAKCMTHGDGGTSVQMSLNLLAKKDNDDYCGILVSNVSADKTEERSIQLAVRVHKTLELADDKFYVITCGKTGFPRDEKDMGVALKFLDGERRVRETVYGREYIIKAEVQQPNATYGIKVKNCFAFNRRNTSINLIDERGCPIDSNIITPFVTEADGKSAVAMLKSMFKFAEGSEVHFQCDIEQCNGKCPETTEKTCKDVTLERYTQEEPQRDRGQAQNGLMLAASSVFVIDPDKAPTISAVCDGIHPPWLLWLVITLAVLFLIMLLMNIFLCTAMSCSCARTEIIEKEPSIIEEYDPYRSWHGSQYGSRYSLHGRENGINKGYTSGGSTIHSNRSLPIDSDHYAIVHSRPGSRHSNVNGQRSRNM